MPTLINDKKHLSRERLVPLTKSYTNLLDVIGDVKNVLLYKDIRYSHISMSTCFIPDVVLISTTFSKHYEKEGN